MAKFPRAGEVSVKENDPMMKRVDMDHAEIGSRRSGMPKDVEGLPAISHVGGTGRQGS